MTSRIDYNNPHGAGELGLPYHYEMVSDVRRVSPFRAAIRQACKGKVVVESGTGTSIMSLIAAGAGAAKVYAIELDPVIAAVARANIAKSGFGNITLLEKSTLDVTRDDLDGHAAEVLIAENLSTWQATEPQVQVMNHMVSALAGPGVTCIPLLADNRLELCCSPYVFERVIELRTLYFQFSGIPAPDLFSDAVLFSRFAMNQVNPTAFDQVVRVTPTRTGTVNGIRLTSPLTVGDGIAFESSDSLMPPVVVPLPRDVAVTAGAPVTVRVAYATNTSWDRFRCEIVDGG
jgi:predicted RNA methylase